MRNELWTKGLVVGIIMLFVGASVLPIISSNVDGNVNIQNREKKTEKHTSSLDENILGYWSFDEGSGNIVHDYSGYNNHGTIEGQTNWMPGVSGSALEIVNQTAIVQYIPHTFDDLISTELTIEGWVYRYEQTVPDDAIIFDGRNYGHYTAGFILYISVTGLIDFYYSNNGVTTAILGNSTMPTNEWTYIAVVFNYTAQSLRCYINGLLDNTVSATLPYVQTSLSAAIGNNRWAPSDYNWAPLNGIVDELRFYNRALSADEILNNYGKPSVEITYPKDGGLIVHSILIQGTSNNIEGNIMLVEVKIDNGIWNNANGITNWSYFWNISSVPYGDHTISARSKDNENKYSGIDLVTVSVQPPGYRPPSVFILDPTEGKIVNKIVIISGSAHDPDGDNTIKVVQLKIDNEPWSNLSGTTSWNYEWDTKVYHDSYHTVYVQAIDNVDNINGTNIKIIVDNTPPEQLIVNMPENGTIYFFKGILGIRNPICNGIMIFGGIGIKLNTSDAGSGINRVEFWVKRLFGPWVHIDNFSFVPSGWVQQAYWFYGWYEQDVPPIFYLLPKVEARAFDNVNNCRTYKIPIIFYFHI